MIQGHIIYGLIDPNTKFLRYIGYTSNIKKRHDNHHTSAKLQKNSHKNNWLNSLIKNGQKAEMIIIEEYATAEELPEAEEFWYNYFRMQGVDLTNDPNFIGKGAKIGTKHTQESKNKMSEALKGRVFSEEHKQNLSHSIIIALKEREQSSENQESSKKRAKSNTGKRRSNNTKKIMSEQKLGSKNINSKMTEEKVIELRKLAEEGVPKSELSIKYNIAITTVGHIIGRRAWQHI